MIYSMQTYTKDASVDLTKKYNILIVDNECDKLYNFLYKKCHNVYVSHTISSCIINCNTMIFDIIFINFNMKDIENGTVNKNVIVDLLKTSLGQSSTILFAINDDKHISLNEYKMLNIDGIIMKPYNYNIVSSVMDTLKWQIEKRHNMKHFFCTI